MNIAKFSIKRPIFITSIVLLTAVSGWVLLSRINVDMFPSVNIPVISITIAYPGAGPEEIENLIAKPVEEELNSISGLKELSSRNQEGFAMIFAKFLLETDIKWAEQEVRSRLARAKKKLPENVTEPVVLRFDPSDQPVVRLAVFADLPPGKLYELSEDTIKARLEQVNDVGAVRIVGGVKREIQVQIDRNKLNDNSLSAMGVARQLQSYGSNVPVGKYEMGDKEISYRSIGQYEKLSQIENSVVSFAGDLGSGVILKSIGVVKDGTEDVNSIGELWASVETESKKEKEKSEGFFSFFKKDKEVRSEHINRPTIFLDVYRQSDKNTVKVTDAVIKKVQDLNASLKEKEGKPAIRIVRDGSRPIRLNIQDVTESIILGIILAVIVVYLFLGNIRSTIITGLALPNSILGAFVLIYLMDFSINIMTLLALSLSVGLLVDDAIVVRENIFRKLESGMKPFKAAEIGTSEVLLAVVATTMTVVAVFFPIGFLKGMVGQFFKQFGLTVVFAMLISMFDALAVAPLLSAYFAGHIQTKTNVVIRQFRIFQDWLDRGYAKVVDISVNRPILVLTAAFIVFAVSIGSVRFVKKNFMPPNDMGEFMVNIQMPPGTSLEGTHRVISEIRQKVLLIPEVDLIATTAGTQEGQANIANMAVMLVPYGHRDRNTSQVKEEVRVLLKDYAYAEASVTDYSPVGGSQAKFNLYIKGEDLAIVADYALKLTEKIKQIPDLIEIQADYRPGKPEFQVRFDSTKMQTLGVIPGIAGTELRYHIAGGVVGKLHENGKEYDIRLRLNEEQRNLEKYYLDTRVPNMQNKMIPLSVVSNSTKAVGPDKIIRQNRSRVIMITGNLSKNGAIGNATDRANEIIIKEFPPPPGVTYEFVGESEDMRELMENIMLAFGLALMFIYLVLSSLYESFITPITILFAIPPAISGAFLGLAITGEMMNIFSMIGIILLMGLVTKNSILLVDYAVEGMRSGLTRTEAIAHAGKVRLRPILMTTFAMIAGTLPLALGIGEVAKMRKSMGVAIVSGLIVSTLITLIVVPAIFSYIDRFREFIESKFRNTEPEDEIHFPEANFPKSKSVKKPVKKSQKSKMK